MDIIKEDVFRKQLKSGLRGGYLFFGEEDYLKNFALRSARTALCSDPTFAVFNDISIAPLDYSPAALVDALMPTPMMAEQKIVSVNGLAVGAMKPGEIDDLCEALGALGEYDYNVLIISVPNGLIDEGNLPRNPSDILKKLSEYLTPVRFDAVTGARLVAWVGKHFTHHGVSASPKVCSLLIDKCGSSMFTLASECEKLSYYVLWNGRNEVTESDVKNVTVAVIDSDAYALTNAILDGRYADAINALGVMKFRRTEPVMVMGEISRTVCEMLAIKKLQSEAVPIQQICSILDIKSEYKVKLYAASAANKSVERLKRALLLCSDADLSLKSSTQGYTAIENLICSL